MKSPDMKEEGCYQPAIELVLPGALDPFGPSLVWFGEGCKQQGTRNGDCPMQEALANVVQPDEAIR
jgi:hypothetical protein